VVEISIIIVSNDLISHDIQKSSAGLQDIVFHHIDVGMA
jgi:hypothetical protein